MDKLISIKLFILALFCFLTLNNVKETKQLKHTDTVENTVSVTHFHLANNVTLDYFILYTLPVSQLVMNTNKVIRYFKSLNESKKITNNYVSIIVSHDTKKLDTS